MTKIETLRQLQEIAKYNIIASSVLFITVLCFTIYLMLLLKGKKEGG